MNLPGMKGDALFGSLAGTKTRSTGCPFYAVSPGINIMAIPSRELGLLKSFCGSGGMAPTIVRFISVTNLMGNTSGKRKLKGRFLTGVHRMSTVIRIMHYFRSSGIIRMSKDVSPLHSVRAVGLRLIFSSLRVLREEVTGIAGATHVSGRTTGRLAFLRGMGTRLRRKRLTVALRARGRSRST